MDDTATDGYLLKCINNSILLGLSSLYIIYKYIQNINMLYI
jgi:hypothetical protein